MRKKVLFLGYEEGLRLELLLLTLIAISYGEYTPLEKTGPVRNKST